MYDLASRGLVNEKKASSARTLIFCGWPSGGGARCAVGVRKPASSESILTHCRRDVSDEILNAIHNRCRLWLP